MLFLTGLYRIKIFSKILIYDIQIISLLLSSTFFRTDGLTIAIGTYKKNINTRVKWHIEHLMHSNINHFPQIHPIFTTNVPINTTFPVVIIPSIEYNRTHTLMKNNAHVERFQTQIDMSTSQKHAALYFLNNTKDNWLIMIDDDAGFYLPNVQKAIYRLSTYFDPEVPLVFGSFVTFGKKEFLGGGGGFLFSRAGARLFLKHFDDWVRTMVVPNDVHMNKIIKFFNMTFIDSFFPGMTSGFIRKFYDKKSLKNLHFKKSRCIRGDKDYMFKNKYFKPNRYANPSLIAYPLNDIFIYHHYWDFDQSGTTWDQIIEKGFPDNWYYYLCNWQCHICIQENNN